MIKKPDEPPARVAFWVLVVTWVTIVTVVVTLLFQEESRAEPLQKAPDSHIWFQLLRFHEGRIFWMGAWETEQECERMRDWYLYEQSDFVGDAFSCPFVKVQKV